MKINKFFYIFSALALTSCAYLDKEPLDTMVADNYFSTANADGLAQYCNTLYPKLIKGHGDPNNYVIGDILEGDMQSDNILYWDVSYKRTLIAFSQHVISATHEEWKWENIRSCNEFLNNYELSPEREDIKHRYAGEILFFKCMDYFNKVTTFGDVPWYDNTLKPGDEDLYKARDSRTLVMSNILRDINQAIEWLPTKSETGVSRINKDAALALKARMCLFEGTFRRYHNIEGDTEFLQAAYDAAGELMKPEYGYSLFTGSIPKKAYYELFIQANYNSNPEIILSKEYDPGIGKGNNVSYNIDRSEKLMGFSKDAMDSYLCAKTGLPISLCGCEGHTKHTTLVAELQNRDPRLLQTTATPENGEFTYMLKGKRPDIAKLTTGGYACSTGYPIVKFYNPEDGLLVSNTGTCDAPIFRYGEILLIRAEAGAELGLDPELDRTVNALRDRVGFTHHLTNNPVEDPQLVKDYPTIKGNNANLIREIRRERRVELMAEGFRYLDLIRWGCGKNLNKPKLGIIPDKASATQDETGYSDEDYSTIASELGFVNGAIDVYTKRMTNSNANFQSPKNDFFYIPTAQIGLNPKLKQNTGWD